VGDAVALPADLVPQLGEGTHLAELSDEADAGVDEEGDATDHLGKAIRRHLPAVPYEVEDGNRGGERVGQFLFRRRPGLLQVVAADVRRVPLRYLGDRKGNHIADEPQGGLWRKDVGSPREILLEDIVLRRALECRAFDTLPFGA